MQYNTQGVFHLNPYPGPFLLTRGKHSTCVLFPQGHLLHGFPSTSFDILDDVSHRSPMFCCWWTHFLRPCRADESHNDWPSRQAISTASSISHENSKRKIKQTRGKANVVMISCTNWDSLVKVQTLNSLWPICSPESCQSFITSLVPNKNFPSTPSTHFLCFHYSTFQFHQKVNLTPWPFPQESPL